MAVEDHYGRGAALAVAERSEKRDRTTVWGRLFDSRAEALYAAGMLGEACPLARIVLGPALAGDPSAAAKLAERTTVASASMTRSGLSLLRDLATRHKIAQDGGSELAAQVERLRVIPTASGGLAMAWGSYRSDLLRSAVWAVSIVNSPAGPPFFVY